MGSGASQPAKSKPVVNKNSTNQPQQKSKPEQKVKPSTPRAAAPGRKAQGFQEVTLEDPSRNSKMSAPSKPTAPPASPRTDQASSSRATSQAGTSPRSNQTTPRTGGSKQSGTQNKDGDDIVFETFYHNSGRVYTCLYRSGIRYYLDNWKTEEWQIFPMKWYNEGRLVTETLISGGQTIPVRQSSSSTSTSSQGATTSSGNTAQSQAQANTGTSFSDDRESTIRHPTKGKLPTYIFEVRRNVNCYYDEKIGQWVKLPIGWELHADMVRELVDQIQEAIPEWHDRCDILSALRTCNYDLDDCLETYFAWGNVITALNPNKVKNSKSTDSGGFIDQIDKMEIDMSKLKQDLDTYQNKLARESELRAKAEKQANEFQTKFTDLEAEAKVAIVQLEMLQNQPSSRPKTARPKTPASAPVQPQIITETVIEQTVDPESVATTQKSAVNLYKVYNGLKLEMSQLKSEMNGYITKLTEAMKGIKVADKRAHEEVHELKSAYRKECTKRKQLYNQLQELRGNIRVFCRCRLDNRVECCLKFAGGEDVHAPGQGGSKKQFRFDKIYPPTSTQVEVFDDTLPIISSCVDGYNVCILAYGQTGSGKTHTMMGPENDPGVNIRSVRELLKICKERDTIDYTLTCSIVEIYNETVKDLLTKDSKVLEIRAHGKTIEIPGIVVMEINNVDDVKKIMKLGDENRSVASTKMNSSSSRSHLIMMINVTGVDKVSNAQSSGILTLCDLAGSERIGKTEATGQRLVEAAAINKSLTSLGQVFSALRTNQLHVPYRNSKLTHILQPCLSGDGKVAMFVAVSPDVNNVTETVSTLQYGSNARQVQLGQAKQNVKKTGPT